MKWADRYYKQNTWADRHYKQKTWADRHYKQMRWTDRLQQKKCLPFFHFIALILQHESRMLKTIENNTNCERIYLRNKQTK